MILLRDFLHQDIDALVSILNDAAVTQYLSTKLPFPYTHSDAKWWIEEGSQSPLIKAVEFNNELIGCVGVYKGEFEYQRNGELGFWLSREYWRKGIMFDVLQKFSTMLFKQTEIVRLFANVFSGNTPSMKLLLKSGFTEEGVMRHAIFKEGRFYDAHVFSKLKS